MAARLSRLGADAAATTDTPATTAGTLAPPPASSSPPPPPPPPPVASALPPAPATLTEIKQLQPTARPNNPVAPAPATKTPGHRFKPLPDKLATRSLVLAVMGLMLFVFPLVSLLAAIGGLVSLRRIRRSDGALIGESTARWAILLGAIGVVVGGAAIGIFLAVGR